MSHRSIRIRSALAAAAACVVLAGTAAPAMAKTRTTGMAPSATQSATGDSSQRKICLSPTVTGEPVVTGSILGKRECKTKAEWEAKGVKFQLK